jgi:hypothetical protein
MFTIVSTRFNDSTWLENVEYRMKNNKIGCSYGAPYMMSPKIELGSLVFVLEMNNSKNKIEGIGLLRNKASFEKKYNVHSERNYNRYTYHGKYRINRDEIEKINPRLLEIFDYILFKEKTHLKRGIGFTTVPQKLLNHPKCNDLNMTNELRELFITFLKTCDDLTKIDENLDTK